MMMRERDIDRQTEREGGTACSCCEDVSSIMFMTSSYVVICSGEVRFGSEGSPQKKRLRKKKRDEITATPPVGCAGSITPTLLSYPYISQIENALLIFIIP